MQYDIGGVTSKDLTGRQLHLLVAIKLDASGINLLIDEVMGLKGAGLGAIRDLKRL